MKKQLGAVLSVTAGLLMATGSLWAHHSDAVYDLTRLAKIKGTVTEHQFINPHQIISMKVKDENGRFKIWQLVGASVARNRAAGWTKDSLKVGDEITVWGFPFRDGRPNLQWERIVKADGKALAIPPGAINDKLARYLATYGKEQLSAEEYETLKKSISFEPFRQQ
jgi:hypothetical protein